MAYFPRFGTSPRGLDRLSAISQQVRVEISSPERFLRALWPGAIVLVAANTVVGHAGKNLPGARQIFRADVLCRIPEVGPNDRAGALEVDFVDRHHHDRARRLSFGLKGLAKLPLDRDMRASVDPQRR